MNRKQRRKLKRLFGKNGGKKSSEPYFVASGGFDFSKGGKLNVEKKTEMSFADE